MDVLKKGEYLGRNVVRRRSDFLLLTLTDYAPQGAFRSHVHEDPGFFLLVSGQHREVRPGWSVDQPPLTLVYHGTEDAHATEVGPRGMRGLNVSLDRRWFAEQGVDSAAMARARVFGDSNAMLTAVRLLGAGEEELPELATELVSWFVACPERQAPGWLRRAKATLDAERGRPLALAELAHEAAVHPVYLARAFRRFYGTSVGERSARVRLAEAARRIAQGEAVGEAAHACGFSDHSHLTRTYRRHVGGVPSDLARIAGRE